MYALKTKYVGEMNSVRLRKQALGTRNLVGARVEMARKNQGMKQKELLKLTESHSQSL